MNRAFEIALVREADLIRSYNSCNFKLLLINALNKVRIARIPSTILKGHSELSVLIADPLSLLLDQLELVLTSYRLINIKLLATTDVAYIIRL